MSKMSPAFPQKCNAGPMRVEEALYLGLGTSGFNYHLCFCEKVNLSPHLQKKEKKGEGVMVHAVQPGFLRFLSGLIV